MAGMRRRAGRDGARLGLAAAMLWSAHLAAGPLPDLQRACEQDRRSCQMAYETTLAARGAPGAMVQLTVPIDVPQSSAGPARRLYGLLIRSPQQPAAKPTVVITTGYRREFLAALGLSFIPGGYNLLVVDLRGTGSSEGVWQVMNLAEQHDIQYIVDRFIPAQPWSDGKVAMYGPSYMGITQLFAAGLAERDAQGNPIHLKALFPLSAMADAYHDVVYHGSFNAEFMTSWLGLTSILGALPPLVTTLQSPTRVLGAWTARINNIAPTLDLIFQADLEPQQRYFIEKSPMIYWPEKPAEPWGFPEADQQAFPSKLPMFLTEGWFDLFTPGVFNNYTYGLKDHDQADKRMIVGPWYHLDGCIGMGIMPLMSGDLPKRWFDWKVKGTADPVMRDYPVMLYAMGADRYHAERSWPLPPERTETVTWQLDKKPADPIAGDWFSEANAANNFTLSPQSGDPSLANPVLVHDPRRLHGLISRAPVRWIMGLPAFPAGGGMNDSAALPWEDERADDVGVLTFSTPALEEDVQIIGPVLLRFWARSSWGKPLSIENIRRILKAASGTFPFVDPTTNLELNLLLRSNDAQFIADLDDVFPDGRARNVSSGWMAGSHRQWDSQERPGSVEHAIDPDYKPFGPFYKKGDENPRPLVQGDLYEYAVEVWPTDNVFKAGHRVRMTLSASDFPHTTPMMVPARHELVIDRAHPASITFQRTTQAGEGTTWRWVDKPGEFVMQP
jgi:hypothetical protein